MFSERNVRRASESDYANCLRIKYHWNGDRRYYLYRHRAARNCSRVRKWEILASPCRKVLNRNLTLFRQHPTLSPGVRLVRSHVIHGTRWRNSSDSPKLHNADGGCAAVDKRIRGPASIVKSSVRFICTVVITAV